METVKNKPMIQSSSLDPSDDPNHLLETLEKQMNWNGTLMCRYNGSWCPIRCFVPMLLCQNNFKSHDTDIILSTMPKSGTTWLKALTFSIVNRSNYPIHDKHHPLLTSNPHSLVPYLEFQVYKDDENPDLENLPSPRLFATHMHYDQLPESLKRSDCRVIFLGRNPKDQFVSYYHFTVQGRAKADYHLSIEEAFEMYCQGILGNGPVWKHMLEYWNAYCENPNKVLFLKYEDLKRDIASNVKKIAKFIGFPFSLEEEEQGLIERICELCNFDNLKNLEVNKSGYIDLGAKNSSFFRKGETGDWVNHLTLEMAQRIDKIVESKLKGSGLTFDGN